MLLLNRECRKAVAKDTSRRNGCKASDSGRMPALEEKLLAGGQERKREKQKKRS
jgi:hypothetical protein